MGFILSFDKSNQLFSQTFWLYLKPFDKTSISSDLGSIPKLMEFEQ